jgi:CMP-N,N'-diacetyllegionaminic acid synthase
LGGKPLIAWTIEEAKKSKYIDRLILSSEDAEIIRIAKEWNCEVPFIRPLALAKDRTPGIAPVLHALKTLPESYDYVTLLQPTSPLRRVDDIDGCIEQCLKLKGNSMISVTEPYKGLDYIYLLNSRHRLRPFLRAKKTSSRRQDFPKTFIVNGAVYFAKKDFILKNKTFYKNETLGYIMPVERSVDIDNEFDFRFAEFLLKRKTPNYRS